METSLAINGPADIDDYQVHSLQHYITTNRLLEKEVTEQRDMIDSLNEQNRTMTRDSDELFAKYQQLKNCPSGAGSSKKENRDHPAGD